MGKMLISLQNEWEILYGNELVKTVEVVKRNKRKRKATICMQNCIFPAVD